MRVRELRIINISPPVSESESRVALIIAIMRFVSPCLQCLFFFNDSKEFIGCGFSVAR